MTRVYIEPEGDEFAEVSRQLVAFIRRRSSESRSRLGLPLAAWEIRQGHRDDEPSQ